MIKIGQVILRERTNRNMTQQQLASFLNVTKATISKWEKAVSYPDITLLPVIAAFFNMTVDELLDAKLTMDKQEIRKWYTHYAERFSKESYEEVVEDVRKMIRLYYDDDNFLLQMSILLLNHAEFSSNAKEQFTYIIEVLERAEMITDDVWIRRQTNSIISTTALFMQQPEIALERSKDYVKPIMAEDLILAQAYEALGQTEEAKKVLQAMIYQQLVAMIGSSTFYLKLTTDEEHQLLETIKRIDGLIDLFEVDQLHPNLSLQFYLAVGQYATTKNDEQLCRKYMTYFTDVATNHLFPFKLKGDAYFTLLDEWFDTLDLGAAPLRKDVMIRESIFQVLKHPMFKVYEQKDWFKDLQKKIQFKLGD